jgi:Tol biopolymer transport system component
MATVQTSGFSNISAGQLTDTVLTLRLTSGSDSNSTPAWTPDGRVVYTKASAGDGSDLYIGDPRDGSAKKLTANPSRNRYPVVSPDGRYIVFESGRSGTAALWRIDIDGGNPIQLTFKNDYYPNFSPDGREVVFNSYANKSTTWKVGIDGGEPVQLIDKESDSPRLSPDGKLIVCTYQENPPKSTAKFAIFSSAGGAPIKLFDVPKGAVHVLGGFRWMADSGAFVYLVRKSGITNVWAQPLDGSAPRQLTNFTSGGINSYDLSRDDKQIAVSRGTSTSDVVLISGFKR